ncbi:hypothetical protein [Streptomyces sp. NPDC021356]|uniref:hypothetical protein n=1 Tax=Streptomyces sp. NPDC021356 TaxID=3154900 RepID=UPI0033C05CAE
MQLVCGLVQRILCKAGHGRPALPQHLGHQALVLPQLLGALDVKTVISVCHRRGAGERPADRVRGARQRRQDREGKDDRQKAYVALRSSQHG